MKCGILQCRHNRQEGCPFEDCDDNNLFRFETVLIDPDYRNWFYTKHYNEFQNKYYKNLELGKRIDCEFADLYTTDNIHMDSARVFDGRSGEFICLMSDLKDTDARLLLRGFDRLPNIEDIPSTW